LVRVFTRQILEGLAYLHGQNIWHRVRAPVDVEQPTNERPGSQSDKILVDANGICKISDFGISKKTPNDAYDSFGNATNMKGSSF
jgi:mitogen-activated protein kinase kinase kinase